MLWDFQIVEYFTINSTICLTAAASPYILILLSNTISNEKLVGNSEGPMLSSESCYDNGKEMMESKTKRMSIRKQLL